MLFNKTTVLLLAILPGQAFSACLNAPKTQFKFDINEKERSCSNLRLKETNRLPACLNASVRLNCPQTCGICCEDDPDYTFPQNKDDSSKGDRPCSYISKNPVTLEVRQARYCEPGSKESFANGRNIRDACPKACGFCQALVETPSPTNVPTTSPTSSPTSIPSSSPSSSPSKSPTTSPSKSPSKAPITSVPTISGKPSSSPMELPSISPSDQPTRPPSPQPSPFPTMNPTSAPTISPSEIPSIPPSDKPSELPSIPPSGNPSVSGSKVPSVSPSDLPSLIPSVSPSDYPSLSPSNLPSMLPSMDPSVSPSDLPSMLPSIPPSDYPSTKPTMRPSNNPTSSIKPSASPTKAPLGPPTTTPTFSPSGAPSKAPVIPTMAPVTGSPVVTPTTPATSSPTKAPSSSPSKAPTKAPVTSAPTSTPTIQCVDNAAYVLVLDSDKEQNCAFLTLNNIPAKNQQRINKYCVRAEVKTECNKTCDFCECVDDSVFEFVLDNGKSQKCDWFTKNSSDTTKRRQEAYCSNKVDDACTDTYCEKISDKCTLSCGAC